MYIRHAKIVAQFIMVIAPAHPMVAYYPAFLGNFVVIRGNHAAFRRGDVLGWVEGECTCAERTGAPPLIFSTMRLAGIFDDSQLMLPCNLQDGAHITAKAIQMYR